MADLPASERPYERCMTYGPQSLTDAELLAVIIRTGTKEMNSTELAKEILSIHKGREGLDGLLKVSAAELTSIAGIGPVKAVQILCIAELSKRIWRARSEKKLDFSKPDSVAAFYMEEMQHRDTECAVCVYLDARKQFLADTILSTGTINETIIHPREVFGPAIQYHAAGIILLHNHPSGDVQPSPADIAVTQRIFQAGKLLGIALFDHLIIGKQTYFSFFQSEHWKKISGNSLFASKR
ncbi:MAG: JAB domain-containing protein [Lachnospiraceae bacterium]|nr:JAB domain-containing protein [Lachnospiraceae bacterium]